MKLLRKFVIVLPQAMCLCPDVMLPVTVRCRDGDDDGDDDILVRIFGHIRSQRESNMATTANTSRQARHSGRRRWLTYRFFSALIFYPLLIDLSIIYTWFCTICIICLSYLFYLELIVRKVAVLSISYRSKWVQLTQYDALLYTLKR